MKDKGESRCDSALTNFESFVSEILTVTKDDIQKIEEDAKAALKREPEVADEETD
ncbi:MAG: hypothetical protein NVSMB31_09830 [Vulcanimicrobiaceae bacterium]